jgi:transposase
MDTIRETLKRKFGIWLDQRCDKGLDTYGHELDDCPDDKFDWRDMLIEELLDGLQYQEKEIRRLKKELSISSDKKAPYADLDD